MSVISVSVCILLGFCILANGIQAFQTFWTSSGNKQNITKIITTWKELKKQDKICKYKLASSWIIDKRPNTHVKPNRTVMLNALLTCVSFVSGRLELGGRLFKRRKTKTQTAALKTTIIPMTSNWVTMKAEPIRMKQLERKQIYFFLVLFKSCLHKLM